MTTLTYTGRLVRTSCWCGIQLAIPEDLYSFATRHRHNVYCPLGHKFIYTDTVEEELKEANARLVKERARLAATQSLLRHEERSHAATRGHVTRKKKQLERVASGVCPCCNRSFADLRRHMKTKHPEFEG